MVKITGYDWNKEHNEMFKKYQKENRALFNKKKKAFNAVKGIRTGDWLKRKSGKLSRVTYIWRDEKGKAFSIQDGGDKHGSFYLGDGYISYSGGLDSGTDHVNVEQLKQKKKGLIWFFRRGFAGAGRGIEYMMDFRIFKEV